MKTIALLMLLSTSALANPTYTQDIQPIFIVRCMECHAYIQGKNWMDYNQAFEWRDSIRAKVMTKEMPMGRDMPQAERDLIIKWVETGAKK